MWSLRRTNVVHGLSTRVHQVMTKEKHVLVNFQEFDKPENVALGDGPVVKALGSGSVRVDMLFRATESKKAVLYYVLYVPKLTCNLFSVRAAVAKGNSIEFGPQNVVSGMKMESFVEWDHWLINSIN